MSVPAARLAQMKEYNDRPENKARAAKLQKVRMQRPEVKQTYAHRQAERWLDPAYRKWDAARRRRTVNRLRSREYHARALARLKKQVFDHYGHKCARCPVTDPRVLSIDHISSDGAAHRRQLSGRRRGKDGRSNPGGKATYLWLVRHNFPPGFQTLCMNCQWIKRHEANEIPYRLSLETLDLLASEDVAVAIEE